MSGSGSSTLFLPMTRVFIFLRSSLVSWPILILCMISPYTVSSLKRWLFSKKIAQLIVFSHHCPPGDNEYRISSDFPTGWSWWKLPEETVDTPPNTECNISLARQSIELLDTVAEVNLFGGWRKCSPGEKTLTFRVLPIYGISSFLVKGYLLYRLYHRICLYRHLGLVFAVPSLP